VYPRLGASDPFSVFIESKRDIGGIKLPVADPLPRTMRTTKYWMRIPASKESAIRREG
jgi:hypothetical protein